MSPSQNIPIKTSPVIEEKVINRQGRSGLPLPGLQWQTPTSLTLIAFPSKFQQSIDTGEIPKEWSLANIFPLFKKNDRTLAYNYCPVSLTCVPCSLGCLNILCAQISWLIWMNINFYQTYNMLLGKDIVVKLS